jgi:hypothetical protein
MGMFAFKLAGAALALFCLGILRDRRSFSNAIFLGIGLALVALGSADVLVHVHDRYSRLLLLAIFLLVAVGPLLVAGYLVHNGFTMARREGAHPRNLL